WALIHSVTNSQSFCISFAMMGYADAVRCGGVTPSAIRRQRKNRLSQIVFVLEDDSDISRLVQHHLEAAGFTARVYGTPTNIVADAERQSPALFLLDIMVPGGDGLDVCRRLRNHSSLSTIPIIFL